MHFHAGKAFISLSYLHDMGEIQSAVHTMTHHIKRYGHNIHISGTFSVSEQCTLYSVCTRQNTKLRIADATASVIMGMHT